MLFIVCMAIKMYYVHVFCTIWKWHGKELLLPTLQVNAKHILKKNIKNYRL